MSSTKSNRPFIRVMLSSLIMGVIFPNLADVKTEVH